MPPRSAAKYPFGSEHWFSFTHQQAGHTDAQTPVEASAFLPACLPIRIKASLGRYAATHVDQAACVASALKSRSPTCKCGCASPRPQREGETERKKDRDRQTESTVKKRLAKKSCICGNSQNSCMCCCSILSLLTAREADRRRLVAKGKAQGEGGSE